MCILKEINRFLMSELFFKNLKYLKIPFKIYLNIKTSNSTYSIQYGIMNFNLDLITLLKFMLSYYLNDSISLSVSGVYYF
jgi:hypothetical protein